MGKSEKCVLKTFQGICRKTPKDFFVNFYLPQKVLGSNEEKLLRKSHKRFFLNVTNFCLDFIEKFPISFSS